MNHHYADILALTDRQPLWWDENAVPRFCEFGPRETANIYADSCCLMLIACQDCGTEFKVAMTEDMFRRDRKTLPELVAEREVHYGDPPNTGCCAAGATMNSVPVKVLEFWRRDRMEWERDHTLEVSVVPEWAIDDIESPASGLGGSGG